MGYKATYKIVKGQLLYRIYRILQAFEEIIDALSVNHQKIKVVHKGDDIEVFSTVRKWHPSYWIGWFRCQVLGDKFGSAMYKKKESKDESVPEAPTEEV